MQNIYPDNAVTVDPVQGYPDDEVTIDAKQENAPGFWSGMGAGITDQPGSGVGHYIGEALPVVAGATLGALGGPTGSVIGAELGEVAKKTAGAIVNPEQAANQSKLGLGADVIGTAALQEAGEAAAPYVGKAAQAIGSKIGETVSSVSDWLSSKIGKSFLKASKAINAYGHEPEKAITDEGIIAHSWDDLIDKAKAAKHDIGEMYDDFFASHPNDIVTDAENVTKPIDTALKEANKYPNENGTLISRLQGLKSDVLGQIDKQSQEGQGLDIQRANDIKKSLYKITKYSSNNSDDIPLNKVKQQVAGELASKIEDVSPEIAPINERYANLVALQNAATNRAVVASNSDIIGIPEMAAGGFLMHGNIPAAAAVEIGGRVLKTPLGATPTMNFLSTVGKGADLASKMDYGSLAKGATSKLAPASIQPLVIKKIDKEVDTK